MKIENEKQSSSFRHDHFVSFVFSGDILLSFGFLLISNRLNVKVLVLKH